MTLRRATQLAKRSAISGGSGAVFVKDGKVIAGGFSLVPEPLVNSQTSLTGVQVAIGLALRAGASLEHSSLYTTIGVDEEIAKLLILAAIRKVESYVPCTPDAAELLEDAGIEVTVKERFWK